MPRRRLVFLGTAVIALAILTTAGVRAAGKGSATLIGSSSDREPDKPSAEPAPAKAVDPLAVLSVPTVRFRWPGLETDTHFMGYYVDLDPTAGLLDWSCKQSTYDGHM